MAETINELIRKKFPTGHDLGRLFVETTIKDIECWRKEKPIKHPYTQDMLNKAFYELPPEDQKIFNSYTDIHDTLIAIYDRNQAYLQQFYNGFYRVKYTLDEIYRNESFCCSSMRFKGYLDKEQSEEFSGNMKNALLRLSNLKKSGRVGEVKMAYALMDDALWDFAACKFYLDTAESLYGLDFKKISLSYFEEAADKTDELSALYQKAMNLSSDVGKYFAEINVSDYHIDTYESRRAERDSSLLEWKDRNRDTQYSLMNNFIKRYKPQIERIKATLKSGSPLKGLGD